MLQIKKFSNSFLQFNLHYNRKIRTYVTSNKIGNGYFGVGIISLLSIKMGAKESKIELPNDIVILIITQVLSLRKSKTKSFVSVCH